MAICILPTNNPPPRGLCACRKRFSFPEKHAPRERKMCWYVLERRRTCACMFLARVLWEGWEIGIGESFQTMPAYKAWLHHWENATRVSQTSRTLAEERLQHSRTYIARVLNMQTARIYHMRVRMGHVHAHTTLMVYIPVYLLWSCAYMSQPACDEAS